MIISWSSLDPQSPEISWSDDVIINWGISKSRSLEKELFLALRSKKIFNSFHLLRLSKRLFLKNQFHYHCFSFHHHYHCCLLNYPWIDILKELFFRSFKTTSPQLPAFGQQSNCSSNLICKLDVVQNKWLRPMKLSCSDCALLVVLVIICLFQLSEQTSISSIVETINNKLQILFCYHANIKRLWVGNHCFLILLTQLVGQFRVSKECK